MRNKQKYRLTAGIVLVCAQKILCGLSKRHKVWGMPQGGIESGETAPMAAARELHEETGVHKDIIWKTVSPWYILPIPLEAKHDSRYSSIYAQKYKWFLCEVSELPQITLSEDEYIDYKWATPEEIIIDNEHSFKKEMYSNILKGFHLLQ